MAKALKKIGRPSKRTPEIVQRVIEGLKKGTPLTIICAEQGMPCDDTIRSWADGDNDLSRAIARARETGWDQIALDAMDIADDASRDTIETEKFGPIPDKEWIARSKLRVETRLKLLAKWDPKRYGDLIKLAGADGKGPIGITITSDDAAL